MRVDFYHLEKIPLQKALPAILQKAYEADTRVLIKTDLAEQADELNTLLWTFEADSFLPHGVEKDGFADKQPIFITHKDHLNPNQARLCICLNNVPIPFTEDFERVLYFFNGLNQASLDAAREQWRKVSELNIERFYWKQNESGKWENKR